MQFHVVYRNVNGKVQPVSMDKPEQAPRVKLPIKSKVIVVDKKTGQVVENVVVSEVDGNIVVTAEQGGVREAVVIEDGQARGVTILQGAPATEMAASIPFEALAVESLSSTALYIGGGLAAAAGGGAAFAASSDKQPPVFLYGPKDQTIAENSPAGSQVYVAQATDNKGKVTYSLKQGSDAGLTIDPVSGKVTLTGTADYETKSSYSFVVVATDAAGNASEQTVTVAVGNLDERGPTITSSGTAPIIRENSGTAQVVYTAAATDTDFVAPGTASSVTYSLKPGSDAGLSIDSHTGRVTLAANPNYEAKSSYSFTIIATDAAGNATEKTVTFNIGNIDEVGPTFTSAATAPTILENSGAGQVIYTAAATDSDFNAPATASSVTYSLKPGSDAGLSIDPQTGRVTLATDPDYETKSSYGFTVIATDAVGNTTEKPVTLSIGDVIEDVTPPTVASVALTRDSENTYAVLNAGDKVTVTVTMSENTIVDTSGGTPRIALNIGGETVYANYTGGTRWLTFEYTILDGQNDANGISIASNSFEANGAILTDAVGNIAVLAHSAVADNAIYKVDNIDPIATIGTQPAQPGTLTYAKFEATGNALGADLYSKVAVLNSSGDFALAWQGGLADTSTAIFVQKCNPDGTPAGAAVRLDAASGQYFDGSPNIYALGTTGKYVVSWTGQTETGVSVFVQIFNADGSKSGNAIKFDSPLATVDLNDGYANISVLNGNGDFVLSWSGTNNTSSPYADSVWVQKISADGALIGDTKQLDGVPTNVNGKIDSMPNVAAIGTDGSYIVTWYGADDTTATNDYSIFSQKFGPDGQPSGPLQKLELLVSDQTTQDSNPKIAALGADGSYAITWYAYGGNPSDSTVYVQKFGADGTAQGPLQRLDGAAVQTNLDLNPNIAAVGSSGKYVVTWTGSNSATSADTSVFVQLFNSDGTRQGAVVQLDAVPGQPFSDLGMNIYTGPQVVALGSGGEFAIAWTGYNDAASDSSVYVQRFNADGSLQGTPQKFDATDTSRADPDYLGQLVALGDNGSYLLTWFGADGNRDASVYIGKFVATPGAGPIFIGSSNEAGKLYLVHSGETVTSEADILALADNKFNAQTNGGANVETALDKTGLADGNYKLYAVDQAGNLSAASTDSVTVGSAQTVFVLGEGYPNLVDGGDGLFNGWDGLPGGDDILQSTTPGDAGYVDFVNNAVHVQFLGIPGDRPLDITGFGADDSIEIFLSDLPQAYYGNAPGAPTTWLNKINFNDTGWNGMTMSGGPSHIYDGKVAMWLNREPYAHLGVNFKTGVDGTHELRLVYNWKSSGPSVAASRLMAFWGSETSYMQVYSNTTVHWPDVAPPPPI